MQTFSCATTTPRCTPVWVAHVGRHLAFFAARLGSARGWANVIFTRTIFKRGRNWKQNFHVDISAICLQVLTSDAGRQIKCLLLLWVSSYFVHEKFKQFCFPFSYSSRTKQLNSFQINVNIDCLKGNSLTAWRRSVLQNSILIQLLSRIRMSITIFTKGPVAPCPEPVESSLHFHTSFFHDPF
jgi:hypothetical protein